LASTRPYGTKTARPSRSAHERGVKSFSYHYSQRFQQKIPAQAPQRRPSLMRIGRSRSSASAKSSKEQWIIAVVLVLWAVEPVALFLFLMVSSSS
jgi:hypothetical protein